MICFGPPWRDLFGSACHPEFVIMLYCKQKFTSSRSGPGISACPPMPFHNEFFETGELFRIFIIAQIDKWLRQAGIRISYFFQRLLTLIGSVEPLRVQHCKWWFNARVIENLILWAGILCFGCLIRDTSCFLVLNCVPSPAPDKNRL